MKTLIIISLLLSVVVIFNYLIIKRINLIDELSQKRKNHWVFIVIYFPIFGGLFYLYKLKNNSL